MLNIFLFCKKYLTFGDRSMIFTFKDMAEIATVGDIISKFLIRILNECSDAL
jgi:hypothetical protein